MPLYIIVGNNGRDMTKLAVHAEKLVLPDVRFSDMYKYTVNSPEGTETRLLKCMRNRDQRHDDLNRNDDMWCTMFRDEYRYLHTSTIAGMPRVIEMYTDVQVEDEAGAESVCTYSAAIELEFVDGHRLSDPNANDDRSFPFLLRTIHSIASMLAEINQTGLFQLDVSRRNIIHKAVCRNVSSFGSPEIVFIDFTGAWHKDCGYTPVCSSRWFGSFCDETGKHHLPVSSNQCHIVQANLILDIIREYSEEVDSPDLDCLWQYLNEAVKIAVDSTGDPLAEIIRRTGEVIDDIKNSCQ